MVWSGVWSAGVQFGCRYAPSAPRVPRLFTPQVMNFLKTRDHLVTTFAPHTALKVMVLSVVWGVDWVRCVVWGVEWYLVWGVEWSVV